MTTPRWDEVFQTIEEIKEEAGDDAEEMDILLSGADLIVQARERVRWLEAQLSIPKEHSYDEEIKQRVHQ